MVSSQQANQRTMDSKSQEPHVTMTSASPSLALIIMPINARKTSQEPATSRKFSSFFPFLTLPSEIRIVIYEQIFQTEPIRHPHLPRDNGNQQTGMGTICLLNRQIYHEATEVRFRCQEIRVSTGKLNIARALAWVRKEVDDKQKDRMKLTTRPDRDLEMLGYWLKFRRVELTTRRGERWSEEHGTAVAWTQMDQMNTFIGTWAPRAGDGRSLSIDIEDMHSSMNCGRTRKALPTVFQLCIVETLDVVDYWCSQGYDIQLRLSMKSLGEDTWIDPRPQTMYMEALSFTTPLRDFFWAHQKVDDSENGPEFEEPSHNLSLSKFEDQRWFEEESNCQDKKEKLNVIRKRWENLGVPGKRFQKCYYKG